MFIALGLLGSVLTFVPTSELQFFTYNGSTSHIYSLPGATGTIGSNAGVYNIQLEFTRDNTFPNTGVSYSFEIGSFTLRDGDTYYDSYLHMYLSYQYNSPIDIQWTLAVVQYDFDSEFGTYPILNYELYSSVDYTINNWSSSSSVQGDNIFPLVYSTNEIYIVDDSQILASGLKFRLNLNFLYLNSSVFNALVDGLQSATADSYSTGYQNGLRDGISQGKTDYINSLEYQVALQQQYDLGKQAGISEGRNEVLEQGQTATIIFNGIISIALLPVNVFLKMLNLEVFGINLGALVSSLLTICVIIILARMIFGKSGE